MISLQALNERAAEDFVAVLAGIFEHSPWVAECAAPLRPFESCIALHRTMCDAVMQAGEALQLGLLRAHPELAGRAAIRGDLTAASTSEQQGAGLANCTPQQYARRYAQQKDTPRMSRRK